jgi:hypothetical protein
MFTDPPAMTYIVTCPDCGKLGEFYGKSWTPPTNREAEQTGDQIAEGRAKQLRLGHPHAGVVIVPEGVPT